MSLISNPQIFGYFPGFRVQIKVSNLEVVAETFVLESNDKIVRFSNYNNVLSQVLIQLGLALAVAKGGKPRRNEGEKTVPAVTGQGRSVSTTWQVVEVNRPLMSVHQICERGNVVVFGEKGGYILNLSDGSQTPFGVEDNV